MKKNKVALDFVKLSVSLKILFCRSVLLDLTGNVAFQSPDVSLADAKLAVDNLEIAALAADGGSKLATAQMHAKEAIVDTTFHILAAYVERMAIGDEAIIISSGFHCTKQPTPYNKLPLVINDGLLSGTVDAVFKAIETAGSYEVEYAIGELPTTEAGWKSAGKCTRAHLTISGLPVGVKCFFRMNATTPKGTTDFCEPVSKIII